MKILIVNNSITHGGVERQIDYTMGELLKKGVTSKIVFYNKSNIQNQNTKKHKYISWPFGTHQGIIKVITSPLFMIKLFIFIKGFAPDVIHTYGPFENLICSIIASLLKVKHVTSIRSNTEWAFKFVKIWGKKCNLILTNAESIKSEICYRFEEFSKKTKVIRNGIDINKFSIIDNKENSKTTTIALIGRVSPSKNQLFFIKTFNEYVIKRKIDIENIKIFIVGVVENKEYYSSLLKGISKSKLQDNVEIKNYTNDIYEIYKKIDLLVLTSETEGLPNVLIEAMAVGIPWVASDVADVKYLSGANNDRGIIFKKNDKLSFFQALDIFFKQPFTKKNDRCISARKFVEKNLTIETLGTESYKLYKGLL